MLIVPYDLIMKLMYNVPYWGIKVCIMDEAHMFADIGLKNGNLLNMDTLAKPFKKLIKVVG